MTIITIISQHSWRDILLTVLLASSILYYFVFQNRGDFSRNNETQVASCSDEERRRRRDHHAKIAEERANKRVTAAADADPVELADNDKHVKEEGNATKRFKSSSKQPVVTSNETRVATVQTDAPKKTANIISAVRNQREEKEPPTIKKKESKVQKNDDGNSKEAKVPNIRQIDGSKQSEKPSNNVSNSADAESKDKKKLETTTAALSSDTKDKQENQHNSIIIYLFTSASSQIEITIPTKAITSSTLCQIASNATGIPLNSLRLIYRGRIIVERSDGNAVKDFGIENGSALYVAASKAKDEKKLTATTSSETKDQQENQQESITIYLIQSASSRIEVTIPSNAKPSQLREVASNATGIPLTALRLIFRGRLILEKSNGNVVKEFGIENGSALHVVGKPKVSTSSLTAPAPQQQQSSSSSPSPQQNMTRIIHQGLQDIPNFFHHAAAVGNYELIQSAIRDGSFATQLNRADENGWTTLHEAVRGGHEHVVTLLISEGGLDMHAITNQGDGYSPLSLCIQYHGENHPLTQFFRSRGGQEVWPGSSSDERNDDDSESSSSDESDESEEDDNESSSSDESNEDEDEVDEPNPWMNL